MMTYEEACAILEVRSDDGIDQVKHAYRNKLKENHPDKHLNDPPEQLQKYEEKVKQILSAYNYVEKNLNSRLSIEIKPNKFSLENLNINEIKIVNFEISCTGDPQGERIKITITEGIEWLEVQRIKSLSDNSVFPIAVDIRVWPKQSMNNSIGKIQVSLCNSVSTLIIDASTSSVIEVDKQLGNKNIYQDKIFEEKLVANMRLLERLVMLKVIDDHWKEHLTAMDHLRQSVGLESVRQIDPLVVYKKKGGDYFDSLMADIQHDIVHTIYKVSIEKREAPAPQRAPVPAGHKVGRNDPCPCGSGKKYKHCHGK